MIQWLTVRVIPTLQRMPTLNLSNGIHPAEASAGARAREELDYPVIDSLIGTTQSHLLRLRWLSVLVMVLAALASPYLFGASELMIRLLVCAMVVGGVNLGLAVAARSSPGTDDATPMRSPLVALLFELAAWGTYIYLSGGATNPLITVFLPLVAIGAIVLTERQAWFLGVCAIGLYSFLWRVYVPLIITNSQTAVNLHLFGMWMVFALSVVVLLWFILQLTRSIRQRERAIVAAREQAMRDDLLISLGSQAAGAVHELSTPLATLNILADDLLDDGRLPSALVPDVRLMQDQIQRCKQTLSQLAARAGHVRGDQSETSSAAAWLHRNLATWQSLNPDLALGIAISPRLHTRYVTPDFAIERAIANLLDNAVKATATCIQITAEEIGGCLELTVADDGHGMSPAAMAAFNQRCPIASIDGMGVGLFLGRAAVERRRGSLDFAPRDSGTAARLRLPLASALEVTCGD
ncbi:ATP-binding protein [uncultured Thiodictyon sp.]|jgi:two-component system sensor histidine kinase RegB|uniref:ATP-binding protein n=1 Tax=uncultured Thiodictyon sp. TaxID=1846217 RepID=UPI0025CEF85C|nr:ATP-binding protein [uncultured Thiodictyon sp.]